MRFRTVLASLAALALAATAGAQTKISGTILCGKADPQHGIEVGDKPGHSLGISKESCTWSKPMEIAGAHSKEGYSVSSDETTVNKSSGSGFHVSTMDNGDKFHVRFYGSAALKDGAPQTAQGKWNFIGGTGKLKGINGQGTYKGKGNADGSVTYEVEGEYQLPK
jgi:hypothetical protein